MPPNTSELLHHFYPESRIGDYTQVDVSVEFYGRIAALLKDTDRVLDYGAGRGGQIQEDISPYRRQLKTLRGRCSFLEGRDVDAAVLKNPYVDHATVIQNGEPLPYEDNSFNLIICNWVFEHITEPEVAAKELLRVLRPGGYICALTVNKWGYVSLAARLTKNRNHVRFLNYIQPKRIEYDVFPTVYKMNTLKDLRRSFPASVDVTSYFPQSEPAYFFGRADVFRLFKAAHRLLPERLRPSILVFIRKL